MKNFILGSLFGILFNYTIGATYFIMKGAKNNVRSCRDFFGSIG